MTPMRIAAVAVFAVLPLAAHAQQSGKARPTVADAQNVVNAISANKARLKIYCDMGALAERLDAAEEKNDVKTAEALADKMDALAEQLGREYIALVDGLQDLPENDKTGEAIAMTLSELDDKCTK